MYELKFDERALASIEKFPKEVKERVVKKLQKAKEDPHHYFEKLSSRGEYKLRIGEYRIIADINDKEIVILVLYADHRRRDEEDYPYEKQYYVNAIKFREMLENVDISNHKEKIISFYNPLK